MEIQSLLIAMDNIHDKRYARVQRILRHLSCLHHPGFANLIAGRGGDYYPGQEWAENVHEVLLPDVEFGMQDPEFGWGVDLDSEDSKRYEEISKRIAGEMALVYWPVVVNLTKETVQIERELLKIFSEAGIRDLIQEYLIPCVSELRQKEF